MIYTGVGSRETPKKWLDCFSRLGEQLAINGHVLRSGHADGADMAFEIGALKGVGNMEIYLPWEGFNDSKSSMVLEENDALLMLSRSVHPNFDALTSSGRKLIMRDEYQVLGMDLKTPTSCVVCWTKDGKLLGGTAQAIRLANKYEIPVFNAGMHTDPGKFFHLVTSFMG